MKALFGAVGLLVVLAIVGLMAKKQLQAAKALPETGAASGAAVDATVQQRSQQIQQQVQQDVQRALQQSAERASEAQP